MTRPWMVLAAVALAVVTPLVLWASSAAMYALSYSDPSFDVSGLLLQFVPALLVGAAAVRCARGGLREVHGKTSGRAVALLATVLAYLVAGLMVAGLGVAFVAALGQGDDTEDTSWLEATTHFHAVGQVRANRGLQLSPGLELGAERRWRSGRGATVGLPVLRNAPTIAASTGSACHSGDPEPSPVLSAMGMDRARAVAAIRLSLGRATTADDIDKATDQLAAAARAASN